MRKLLLLLFISISAYCQTPSIVWDKTIGGSGWDMAASIIASPDGGFVIAGHSTSGISGDKSEANKGDTDLWIIKINSVGNILWDKTIGGSDGDHPSSIIASPDGGFVIAGHSYSGISGDKSEVNKGGWDYWIVKINSVGNILWDKTIGGSDSDVANSIIASPDGGFVIAGSSTSAGVYSSSSDYRIVKINSSGNILWDKTIGGSSYDVATSIIASPDGGFVIAGYSRSGISDDKTEASKGNYDYWIVKINSSGDILWDKSIGGSSGDSPYSIIGSPDGGFVIAGYSISGISGDKSEANKGNYDYWIVKINSSGNILWDKSIGGSRGDLATSIIASPDGGFVIAGRSQSGISGDKSEANKGSSDLWIVKINSSGNILWDKTIGGSDGDYPSSIIASPDGGFVIAGYSTSGISGDKSEASKGSRDYWIVKLAAENNQPDINLSSDFKFGGGVSTLEKNKAYTVSGGIKNTSDASWYGDIYMKVGTGSYQLFKSGVSLASGNVLNLYASYTFTALGQNLPVELFGKETGSSEYFSLGTINSTKNPIYLNIVEPRLEPTIGVPFIRLNKSLISPGETIQIVGGNFQLNSDVILSSEPYINAASYPSYTVGSDGSIFGSFTIPSSFTNRYLNIVVLDSTKTNPSEVVVVSQPTEVAELKISKPNIANQSFTIPPNGSIPIEIIDKLLLGPSYSSTGASRNYSYEIGFQLAGENTFHTLIQISGFGLINEELKKLESVPLIQSMFSTPTAGNGISLKIVVKDLLDNSRLAESPYVFIKVGQQISRVLQKWDKSKSVNPTFDPLGIAADGVARIYLVVEKVNASGSPIKSVQIGLSSLVSDTYPAEFNNGAYLGRLKYATQQNNNSYSEEANGIHSIDAQNNGSNANGKYWFWYVAPNDFTKAGLPTNLSYDLANERRVLANMTIIFEDNSQEQIMHEIIIVRPPLMLVHGWMGAASSFDEISYDSRIWLSQTLIHKNSMHPHLSLDFNSNILLGNIIPESYKNSSFESVINNMRNKHRIASSQVDYVAHSMGGIMLRNILSKRSSNYLKSAFFQTTPKTYPIKNYTKGWVHKYITINTPHFGSPGADILAGMLPLVSNRLITRLRNIPLINIDDAIYKVVSLNGEKNIIPSEAVRDMQTNVASGGKTDFLGVDGSLVPSHVIISDINLGINENSPTPNFYEDLYNSNGRWKKVIGQVIYPLLRNVASVNVDENTPSSIFKDFISLHQNEVQQYWIQADYELRLSKWSIYFLGLNPKGLEAFGKTFQKYGEFNNKYSDIVWNGDLVVPNFSQSSGLPYNAGNLTFLTNSKETDLESFHLGIQKREKTIDKVFELLNSSVHSNYFGSLPANNNPQKRVLSSTYLANNDKTTVNDKNQIVASNPYEQYDINKIKINSPSRMADIARSGILEIEVSVIDTASLSKVELQLGGVVMNVWNKSKEYIFSYNTENLDAGSQIIFATAFYDIAGQEYLKYDSLSINIIFEKEAAKFDVFPQVKQLNIEESFSPNYELHYGNEVSSLVELSKIGVSISNAACLSYNAIEGEFTGLQKCETTIIFNYDNKFKDTMYVAVGGGGVPYAQSILTNNLNSGTVCTGQQIQVPFTISGGEFEDGNQFLVQISNKNGQNYRLLESTGNASPISVKIPNDLVPSSGYQIRVISTEVPVIGSPSSTNLTISSYGAAPSVSSDKIEFRTGESVVLSASGCANSVKWSNGQIGNQITVSPSESIVYYAVCTNLTCESVNSEPIIIGKYLCESNLTPFGNIDSGTLVREAGVEIISTEKISGNTTNINYEAPSTLLNPGFEAGSGAVFKVIVGGCE